MVERDVDIDELFKEGNEDALRTYLRVLHPADIAELLTFVDTEDWAKLSAVLEPEVLAEVLADLDESQREDMGEVLSTESLIEAVDELETDDAADVLADLPEEKSEAILEELEDRADIEALLAYPEDSAGGIMQTEVCRVDESATVGDAIEAIRKARDELEDIYGVYVVNAEGQVKGTLDLTDLVLNGSARPVATIMEPVEYTVTVDVDQEEVANLFRKYDVATMPVVGSDGVLLGRITFDDVHDVLEEEASEDIMTMAGASVEELVYGGDFLKIALHRLPWLVVSLFGTLVTKHLVEMFDVFSEGTGDIVGESLVLASFVPVVMAMSGNIGSQSAMIITRGFAIGRVEFDTLGRTVLREVTVGMLIGFIAATVVGSYAAFVDDDAILGLALGVSLMSSMTAATLIGVGAPSGFRAIGVDPAIAAGPLVTTTCDMVGVSVYLGVALLMLA